MVWIEGGHCLVKRAGVRSCAQDLLVAANPGMLGGLSVARPQVVCCRLARRRLKKTSFYNTYVHVPRELLKDKQVARVKSSPPALALHPPPPHTHTHTHPPRPRRKSTPSLKSPNPRSNRAPKYINKNTDKSKPLSNQRSLSLGLCL